MPGSFAKWCRTKRKDSKEIRRTDWNNETKKTPDRAKYGQNPLWRFMEQRQNNLPKMSSFVSWRNWRLGWSQYFSTIYRRFWIQIAAQTLNTPKTSQDAIASREESILAVPWNAASNRPSAKIWRNRHKQAARAATDDLAEGELPGADFCQARTDVDGLCTAQDPKVTHSARAAAGNVLILPRLAQEHDSKQ